MIHRERLKLTCTAAMAVLLLAGCGAIQITDGTGKTQTLGQLIDRAKDPAAPASTPEAKSLAANRAGAATLPPEVPGKSTDEWPAEEGCRVMPTIALGVDVDTGYARAMQRFSFTTAEQMQRLQQSRNDFMIPPNFKHERQAGAFYRLAQRVGYTGPAGAPRRMFLDLTLAKEGPRATATARYCVNPAAPDEMTLAHHRHVQRVIAESLNQLPNQ